MDRRSTFLRRLQRLIPGGPSTGGWNLARQQVSAMALAGSAEQMDRAEEQLHLGVTVQRDGLALRVVRTRPGASGYFLDRWGETLGVPRVQSEGDDAYRRRILLEHVRFASNGEGMASLFDDVLSTTGTKVRDSAEWLQAGRFGGGDRAGEIRAVGFDDPSADLFATFCILLPGADSGHLSTADARAMVRRRKVAGTRLLAIATTRPAVHPDANPQPPEAPSRFGAGARFNEARGFSPEFPFASAPRFNADSQFNSTDLMGRQL